MATQPPHARGLARLHIPPGGGAQTQQPLFTPGPMTAFHPQQFAFAPNGMPVGVPLQTPLQGAFGFGPQAPPGAPRRPGGGHRAHPSLALSMAGIHPLMLHQLQQAQAGGHMRTPTALGMPTPGLGPMPTPGLGGPMTPGGFAAQQLAHAPGARGRRGQSISVGGPPKAVLGGAGRNYRPPETPIGAVPETPAPAKAKKYTVVLPREGAAAEEDERKPALWAREPLRDAPQEKEVPPPELATGEIYPQDFWRREIPDTVDVFLPGKPAWEPLKRRLAQDRAAAGARTLPESTVDSPAPVPRPQVPEAATVPVAAAEHGIGSYSTHPGIHAPHARAASISSPADPALLMFKLSKLHAQRAESASPAMNTAFSFPPPGSMLAHPHPLSSSISPAQSASPGHGYSQSLGGARWNPFGPGATLGGGDEALANVSGGAEFVRGFGLDVPSEADEDAASAAEAGAEADVEDVEEDAEEDDDEAYALAEASRRAIADDESEGDMSLDVDADGQTGAWRLALRAAAALEDLEDASLDVEGELGESGEGADALRVSPRTATAHSRHVSRLSLRSVGGASAEFGRAHAHGVGVGEGEVGEEWTGSEDVSADEDGSIGEWSNPSDEERARQERAAKRARRAAGPRRLPDFPRPPAAYDDEDLISNPSMENMRARYAHAGVHSGDFARATLGEGEGMARPMTASSARYSVHDPALAHSRNPSAHDAYYHPHAHAHQHAHQYSQHAAPPPPIQTQQQPHSLATPAPLTASLNPFAKPFVFGSRAPAPATLGHAGAQGSFGAVHHSPHPSNGVPATAHPSIGGASLANGLGSDKGHSRANSLGRPLNVAAPEFKPSAPRTPSAFNVAAPEFRPSFALPKLEPVVLAPVDKPLAASTEKLPSALGTDAPTGEPTPFTFRAPEGPAVPQFTFPQPAPAGAAAPQPDSIRAAQGREKRQRVSAGASGSEDEDDYGERTPDSVRARSFRFPPPALADHFASTSTFGGVASPELVEDLGTGAAPASARGPAPGGVHELPVPLSMKARRAPIPLDFTHPVSRNTVPAGLFKALGNGPAPGNMTDEERTRRGVRSRLASRDLDAAMRGAHSRSDSLDDVHVPAISHKVSRGRLAEGPAVPALPALQRRRSSLPGASMSSLSDMGLAEGSMSVAHRLEMLHHVEDRLGALLDAKLGALQLDEAVAIAKAQLEDAAGRGLREDAERAARGELDFELVRDVLEQGLADARAAHRADLAEMLAGHAAPAAAPAAAAPVDYDTLTDRLAQAVKPHISQLIDLASDKRETAALVADALRPHLASLTPARARTPVVPPLDGAALLAEVRAAVAPLDAHVIKEHVADLVAARLDARLAVHDRALEALPARVGEPLGTAVDMLSALARGQDALAEQARTAPEALRTALAKDFAAATLASASGAATAAAGSAAALSRIEDALTQLHGGQKMLADQSGGAMAVLGRLGAMPDALAAVEALRAQLAGAATKDDLEELRAGLAANSDTQLQLAKARSLHGAARAEKEMLAEHARAGEVERERLRERNEELAARAAAEEARARALDEELAQVKAKAAAADAASAAQAERIAQLEKANAALAAEKDAHVQKAHSAEKQTAFATRDADLARAALADARREHAAQLEQHGHLGELRAGMEALQAQLAQRSEGELADARAARDRAKALEGEYAALQRRMREQEARATNADRAAAQARTSLATAQARAAEWEKRARDVEREAAAAQAKAEEAAARADALEADREVEKMQAEEKDAQERLAQNRESQLRDQVASLEGDVTRLQGELARMQAEAAQERAKAKAAAAQPPPRPDSRASTAYGGSRSATPVKSSVRPSLTQSQTSVRSNTPPTSSSSIWDSIHAPKGVDARSRYMAAAALGNGVPKSKPAAAPPRPGGYYARGPAASVARAASPALSVASAAPTLRSDGWYE